MRFFMVAIAFLTFASNAEAKHRHRHQHHHQRVARHHPPHYHYATHESSHASANVSGLVGGLASKAMEIVGSCASRIISTVRPGAVVAGSGHPSLHRDGRAVDIQGNPSCIYAHLRDWPGGYSVDYSAVRHVHVSLGGREDGARFRHGGGHRRHRMRYAGA
jgi:hypothetical protein